MPASGESGRSNDSAVNNSPLSVPTHPSSSLSGPSGTLREHEPQERVERWLGGAASSSVPPMNASSYPSRPYGGKLFDPVSKRFVDSPRSPQAIRGDASNRATVDEARQRSHQVAGDQPLHIDTSLRTRSRRDVESSLSPSQEEILPPKPPSLPARPDNPYLNSSPPSTRRLAREKARPATPTAQHQIPPVSTPDQRVSVHPSDEHIDRILQAQDRILEQLQSHNTSAATITPTYQQTSLPHMPSDPIVGSWRSFEPAMPWLSHPPGHTSPGSSSPMRRPYGHLSPVSRTQSTASPPGRSPASHNRVHSFLADQGRRSWQHTDPNFPIQRWSSNDGSTTHIPAPFPAGDPAVTQTASPADASSMANVKPRRDFDPTAKEFIPSNPQADGTATGHPSAEGRDAVP